MERQRLVQLLVKKKIKNVQNLHVVINLRHEELLTAGIPMSSRPLQDKELDTNTAAAGRWLAHHRPAHGMTLALLLMTMRLWEGKQAKPGPSPLLLQKQ